MIKAFTFFLFALFTISSFSQTNNCSNGSLNFYSAEKKNISVSSLVKDGKIFPTASIQSLFCLDVISDQFAIAAVNENNLSITHLGTSSEMNVSLDLLDTKASLKLCVDEFTDKLTFFFLSGSDEVIFNSTNGIPFLTFTKID